MAKKATQSTSVLPQDVAEQYEVVDGLVSQFACPTFGHVDLTTINLEFAERLAQQGYLKKLHQMDAH